MATCLSFLEDMLLSESITADLLSQKMINGRLSISFQVRKLQIRPSAMDEMTERIMAEYSDSHDDTGVVLRRKEAYPMSPFLRWLEYPADGFSPPKDASVNVKQGVKSSRLVENLSQLDSTRE